MPIRVEAAAYRGKPVYFEIMPAVRKAEWAQFVPTGFVLTVGLTFFVALAVLTVRNLRRRRGDVRGAKRLGLATVTVLSVAWLIGGHHTLTGDGPQVVLLLGSSGSLALLYGLIYLALEPAVRRRWPWRITAWNRLLDGRWRDPMVGRDLLVGLALGAAVMLIYRAEWLSAAWAGDPQPPLTGTGPVALLVPGPPTPAYVLLRFLTIPIIIPLLYLSFSFVLFVLLRREWLAWAVVWLFFVLLFVLPRFGPSPTGNALAIIWDGLRVVLWLVALSRFGLLAMAASLLGEIVLSLVPLTSDLSAWYAYQGVLGALAVIALAVYAFVTATGGQRLFREGFFGDE